MTQQAHCSYCELSLNCRRCGKPVTCHPAHGGLQTIAEAEEYAIVAAVQRYGSLKKAAQFLGMSTTTIYRRAHALPKVKCFLQNTANGKQKQSLGAL